MSPDSLDRLLKRAIETTTSSGSSGISEITEAAFRNYIREIIIAELPGLVNSYLDRNSPKGVLDISLLCARMWGKEPIMKVYSAEVIRLVDEAEAIVAKLRAEGWTREDFVEALGEFFEETPGQAEEFGHTDPISILPKRAKLSQKEFNELRDMVYKNHAVSPYLRVGQWAFKCLWDFRNDIARQISDTDFDPYYLDSRLPAFWEYLEGLVE